MSTRGSQLSRIIAYAKEGDLEEVRYIHTRISAILVERARSRPNKVTTAQLFSQPIRRRTRRTAAQIAAFAAATKTNPQSTAATAAGE